MTQCRETAKKTKAATVSRNCFTATRFYTAWPGQMRVIEICTKPLARRTLPRVRGSAVGEGLK
jgi:hypothetical protein